MKRILPDRPLSQKEKSKRWLANRNAKSTNLTFMLTDPDELAVYEFLQKQDSKRKTIIAALKLYMETIDK